MTAKEPEDLSGQRDTLEESIRRLRRWMLRSIAVVTAGLVVELCVVIIIVYRTRDPLQLAEAVGTFLVALGVGSELAVEFAVHLKEKQLRMVNDKIETGYKETLAAAADKIAELRKELTPPRRLTDAQKAEMLEMLTLYSGQQYVASCVNLSPEIADVCMWLSGLLKQAGWQLLGSSGSILIQQSLALTGIRISTGSRAEQKTRDAADLLSESLQTFEITANRCDDEFNLPAAVSITIGSRPQ
jgi:hypothetical protein